MAGSTINPSESYEKILTANLQRVIDFLKFAEAKNAALLALTSAWIVAIINLECSGKLVPDCLSKSIPWIFILSLGAAFLSMLSFMPRLSLPKFLGGKRAGPHPKNLLYYGDIASMSVKTLAQELRSRYYPEAKEYKHDYINDLIVQIRVNSEITLRKMKLFRCGMVCIFLAGFVLLMAHLCVLLKGFNIQW